jgi:hypothetical protein
VTITQFVIMAIVSTAVTIPAVWLIPRARQSPVFDRVLWIATWVLAFLGAYSAPSYFGAGSSLNSFVIGDLAIAPMVTGAVVGALSINGLLWLMDRFGGTSVDENATAEELGQTEEQDGGTNPGDSNPHPR